MKISITDTQGNPGGRLTIEVIGNRDPNRLIWYGDDVADLVRTAEEEWVKLARSDFRDALEVKLVPR